MSMARFHFRLFLRFGTHARAHAHVHTGRGPTARVVVPRRRGHGYRATGQDLPDSRYAYSREEVGEG